MIDVFGFERKDGAVGNAVLDVAWMEDVVFVGTDHGLDFDEV